MDCQSPVQSFSQLHLVRAAPFPPPLSQQMVSQVPAFLVLGVNILGIH